MTHVPAFTFEQLNKQISPLKSESQIGKNTNPYEACCCVVRSRIQSSRWGLAVRAAVSADGSEADAPSQSEAVKSYAGRLCWRWPSDCCRCDSSARSCEREAEVCCSRGRAPVADGPADNWARSDSVLGAARLQAVFCIPSSPCSECQFSQFAEALEVWSSVPGRPWLRPGPSLSTRRPSSARSPGCHRAACFSGFRRSAPRGQSRPGSCSRYSSSHTL